ncbi:unnamed protein product [Gongylonema pulchrum]|uniref:MitMem_reg domain-containing protein n=1 Tax=Gongylonema pulchrum TaxID=637853 RepID=A0A183DUH8_9BILA|nr:unnamed protein product [Gongylonema pulchrum]
MGEAQSIESVLAQKNELAMKLLCEGLSMVGGSSMLLQELADLSANSAMPDGAGVELEKALSGLAQVHWMTLSVLELNINVQQQRSVIDSATIDPSVEILFVDALIRTIKLLFQAYEMLVDVSSDLHCSPSVCAPNYNQPLLALHFVIAAIAELCDALVKVAKYR